MYSLIGECVRCKGWNVIAFVDDGVYRARFISPPVPFLLDGGRITLESQVTIASESISLCKDRDAVYLRATERTTLEFCNYGIYIFVAGVDRYSKIPREPITERIAFEITP